MMGQRPSHRVNSAPALASGTASQAEEGLDNSDAAVRSHSEALPSSASPAVDPESEFEVISIDGDSSARDNEAHSTIRAQRA